MKVIKKACLLKQGNKSDEVFEVDFCEVKSASDQTGYVVNIRYGKRNRALIEGSKTPDALEYQPALEIYKSIIVSKLNAGYISEHDLDIQIDPPFRQSSPQRSNDEQSLVDSHSHEKSSATNKLIKANVLQRLQKLTAGDNFLGADIKRAVWRAGELRIGEAADSIATLAGKGDGLLNYCIAWSLGRCGNSDSIRVLETLIQSAEHDSVKRIGTEALLNLVNDNRKKSLFDSVIQILPANLQACLSANDYTGVEALLDTEISQGTSGLTSLLYNLYLLALQNKKLHDLLLLKLPSLPLKPNYFRAIRYIFKAAEFRCDARMYGLCNKLIDATRPFYHKPDSYWSEGRVMLPEINKYVSVDSEVKKENSRLAFSNRTKQYLRRRVWRVLDRMGRADEDYYVDMASGVLLSFSDQDAGEPFKSQRYDWENNRYIKVEYPIFYRFFAFNQILYKNSSRFLMMPSGLSVQPAGDAQSNSQREEAYPAIWDRYPNALIKLLCQSQCEPVHEFAVKAIAPNQAYLVTLALDDLKQLLKQQYAKTAELAYSIVILRYKPKEPDIELLGILFDTVLDKAREQARQWLQADPQLAVNNTHLLVSVVTSNFDDIRQWSKEFLPALDLDKQKISALLARLLAWIQGLNTDKFTSDVALEPLERIVDHISWVLENLFAGNSNNLDIAIIEDLATHPLDVVKKLAGELLLSHDIPIDQLPAKFLRMYIESPVPVLHGIGIKLFGKLPVEILLEQKDLIMSYCLSETPEVRRASRSMVQRLASQNKAFALSTFDTLLPYLFRKEPTDGLHQDILYLLTEDIDSALDDPDKNLIWRLLNARSNGANRYGSFLLHKIDCHQLSVRQWSRLGRNPVLATREWAWKTYRENIDTIRQNPVDALRLMDSHWDDTRGFAIDYFKTHFGQTEWTPELMIGVCDSVREDVQRFGREMLVQYFKDEYGVECLSKLSEHPSENVQLFTTNYLSGYAAGDLERIEALFPYFVTVLSHVNKCRVAKSRIIRFLYDEAMKSPDAARIAAKIFSRQSVTIVLRDLTEYLTAMRDMQLKYPFIDLPIKKRPVVVRTKKAINHVV